jgi:hypothetical protein
MSGTRSTLRPEEIVRYWDVYFATMDTLFAAQSKLASLESSATDLGERSGFRADRLRTEADIELMRMRRTAFNSDAAVISPPDQKVVDDLVALAKTVAGEAANRARAAAIVGAATKATQEFAKVQPA